MHFVDSHCHLTDLDFFPNPFEVIERAKNAKVSKLVNVCSNQKSLEKATQLQKKYEFLYLAAATSPHDVEKEGLDFFPIVEGAAKDKKLIAIGETGLDYYYEYSKKEIQKKFFINYLLLAQKYYLPVIIHCRDAFEDLFSIMGEFYKSKKAILHCFTGKVEEAKEAINRGWYISFSGIVTFKNSNNLREVVNEVPIDKILIETDSPFLAPQTNRGKKNEPAFVIEVAECIAKVKGMDLKEVARVTTDNAMKIFSI